MRIEEVSVEYAAFFDSVQLESSAISPRLLAAVERAEGKHEVGYYLVLLLLARISQLQIKRFSSNQSNKFLIFDLDSIAFVML